MPGSVAESRSSVSNYKGDAGAKGAGGYTLKPSSQNERSSVGARRGSGQGSEVRLGKLQVTVWLGLALGSIVGSYFVGFFAGRYVGFDAARASSAGEVAKLPAPESFNESAIQNPGGVYDKLKSPAILRDSVSELAQKRAASNEQLEATKRELPAEPAVREARIVDEDAEPSAQIERTVPLEDSSGNEQVVDQLFDGVGSGEQLIIGAEEELAEKPVPSSVRMLGAGKAEEAKVAKAQPEKSASALLDERIASAKAAASTTETKSADKKSDNGPLVRKVIPSGYFAQVAAPKKMNEAEAIAGKLKRSGFPVVIESASVAGQNFYRVLVGPEENKVQADRLVSQLDSESYISGKPFIRKVK
jgi:cell division septation protein DedD